jgi:hypothetical protein
MKFSSLSESQKFIVQTRLKDNDLVLVFSLPFCLLLPDGDYAVKLANDDIVNLNLSKVIPTIYDERLPYRGFKKGELDNISQLSVMFRNGGKKIDVSELPQVKEYGTVIKYFDKSGNQIIPELDPSDADQYESEMMNDLFKKRFKDIVPADYLEQHSGEAYHHGRRILINGEITRDRFGRFRYTKVKYNSTKQLHYKEEFNRAIKAVNILIDVYRQETFDYWITNVTEKEIFIYKNISEQHFQVASSTKGFSQIRPDHDLETVKEIKDELINPKPQLPYFMLMLDAQESLDRQKYFLSVIYAVTALESFVKMYLIICCNKRNFTAGVKKRLTSSGLTFLINTILRIFVTSNEFTDDLITRLEEGIKLRNKVIHQTKLDVSESEARSLLRDVKETARILACDLDKKDGEVKV